MNSVVADVGRRYVDRLRRRRQRKKSMLKKSINAIVLYLINKLLYRKQPVPETNNKLVNSAKVSLSGHLVLSLKRLILPFIIS